jgi:hypothetical protein
MRRKIPSAGYRLIAWGRKVVDPSICRRADLIRHVGPREVDQDVISGCGTQ